MIRRAFCSRVRIIRPKQVVPRDTQRKEPQNKHQEDYKDFRDPLLVVAGKGYGAQQCKSCHPGMPCYQKPKSEINNGPSDMS